jgi:site-specific DNA-methyltransferase (adenine-specific)
MPDKSVDLIVTDPPYGMNFQSNYRKEKHRKIDGDDCFPLWIFNAFFRIARNGVYVFCRWDNLSSFPKPKSFLAWVKNNWSMGDLKHEHGRQWEGIAFYNMENHKFIKRIPDVIHAKRTGNNFHPTEKPIDLMETIISSNVGNLIFDPFMGSGTTGVACKNLGRNFIGFEKDATYFEIAKKRIEQTEGG